MDKKLLSSRKQSFRALDSLNFFLADIQGGVGPFLVIFLSASLHWHPARIGIVMTTAGIVGLLTRVTMPLFSPWLRSLFVALIFFWFAMPETKVGQGQKTGQVGEQQA